MHLTSQARCCVDRLNPPFTFVAVTNIVNFIVSVGGYHWAFLNSGNVTISPR